MVLGYLSSFGGFLGFMASHLKDVTKVKNASHCNEVSHKEMDHQRIGIDLSAREQLPYTFLTG